MKTILGALLFIVSLSAFAAGSSVVTWTAPIKNTDNTTIPATGPDALVSYKVEWGTCNGPAFGTAVGSQIVPLTPLSYTVTALSAGITCFRVYATNNGGSISAPTNPAQATIPASTPNPPGSVTVTPIAPTAYKMRISPSDNSFSFVAIGTLKDMSIACGENYAFGQIVGGAKTMLNTVPQSAIKMASKFDTIPPLVYAVCT